MFMIRRSIFAVLGLMLWALAAPGRADELKYPGDVNWAKGLMRYADYGDGHVVGVVPYIQRFAQEVALSTGDVVSLDKTQSCFYMVRGSSAPRTGYYKETGGVIQVFATDSSTEPPRAYPEVGGPLARNQAVSMTLLMAKAAKPRMYSENDAFYCGPRLDFSGMLEVTLRWPQDKNEPEKKLQWKNLPALKQR
jgi:hypothetical protein